MYTSRVEVVSGDRARSILAAMNWRRGILLAGIHLAIVGLLIVMLEDRDAGDLRDGRVTVFRTIRSGGGGASGKGATSSVNDCAMIVDSTRPDKVTVSENLPAIVLTGWRQACHARWSLAGIMNVDYFLAPSPSSMIVRKKVDWGFGFLVTLQWILVGGFPLILPRHWWVEPGAFITCCTAIGFGLAFFPPLCWLAPLPALLAAFAWFWWFGLLVWSGVRFGWKRFVRRST